MPNVDYSTIAEDLKNKKFTQGTFGKPLFGQEYIELKFENWKTIKITANPSFVPLKILFQFNGNIQEISADQYQSLFNLLIYASVDSLFLPGMFWSSQTAPVTLVLSIEKSMIERNYRNTEISGKGVYAYFHFLELEGNNKIQLTISADRIEVPMNRMPNPSSVFLSIVIR